MDADAVVPRLSMTISASNDLLWPQTGEHPADSIPLDRFGSSRIQREESDERYRRVHHQPLRATAWA